MRKLLKVILPLLFFFFTACGSSEVVDKPVYKQIEDFYGKKVATTIGSSQEAMLAAEHPQIEILRFDTDADLLNALSTYKCEAATFDYHIYAYFNQIAGGLTTLEKPLFRVGIGACFAKGVNVELREQFNAFIQKLKDQGIYDQIVDRWINNAHTSTMPDIPVPVEGKPLRVGTHSSAPPLVFMKDGEFVGMDIEIVKRFAAHLGRPIVFSDMNFSALIPSVVSRTQDMIICGINITEERKLSVDFSDPYYFCNAVMVIRNENSPEYVEVADKPVYKDIKDFYGKKVATATGSYQEAVLEAEHPEIEILRFDTDADLFNSLLTNKCEAIGMDNHIFAYFDQVMEGVVALDARLFTAEMGVSFGKGYNVELREQFNDFLKKLKTDGIYDEIVDRWIYNAHTSKMPEITVPEAGNPIRIATNSGSPPLVFVKDGELVGFDVEIAKRFAASIGRPIVWSDMNFSALIPALVSRKQDMAMAGMNITEQRKQSVDFSDPYYECYSIMVIREENSESYVAGSGNAKGESFIQSIVTGFKRNILEENRYLLIWDGLKITVIISLLACIFGTLLGAVVCWM